MARNLSVNEICERALRKIGAYSINDTGADAVEMDEARWWLDMLVGHVTARKRTWWLVPTTATLTLVAGTASYDLKSSLSGSPDIQHIVQVLAVPTTGTAQPVEMDLMRRQAFEELLHSETGPPQAVFIDRARTPALRVWPTPPSPVTHTLRVVYQKFVDDTTALDTTEAITNARQSWGLYLVTALAAEIGAGPVRRLPQDEVKDMQEQAKRLLHDLEAFEEAETPGTPRRVEFYDF